MRFFLANFYLPLILSITLFGGCSTQPDFPERSRSDLSEAEINSFNQFEETLYASTAKGLYRKEKTDTSWVSLGLTQKEVLEVVFLPDGRLLAAVRINDFNDGIPSLFLSTNDGQSWQPYMSNYGGETDITWIGSITATSIPSDTVLTNGGAIARSINGGQHWEVYGEKWFHGGGWHPLIITDPFHAGNIWAGGADAILLPYLLKSEDWGKTWQSFSALENIEATVYDVAVKPTDEDVILVGFGGGVGPANVIRKTIDGGKTWHTAYEDINTRTFTHSALNPAIVYASGVNQAGSLFFLTSTDFGETWQKTEIESEESRFIINDMLSVMQEGREVLYLGTNRGLYTYPLNEE